MNGVNPRQVRGLDVVLYKMRPLLMPLFVLCYNEAVTFTGHSNAVEQFILLNVKQQVKR